MSNGILFLFLAGVLWGTIGPVSRFVFTAGVTPLETAFWRGTVAGLCYLGHYLLVTRGPQSLRRRTAGHLPLPLYKAHIPAIVLFGVFGVAALECSYVYTVSEGGAALASILLYSAPLWVNLFSWKFLGEKISPRQIMALFMTSCGIAGISLWGGEIRFSTIALVAGLVSGVSYALFYIAGQMFFRRSHPVAVYMIAFPIASVAVLPLIYFTDSLSPSDVLARFVTLAPQPMLALVGIGIISTYVPYILHGMGLRLVESGKAAIVTMIEPVVAIVLSHIIWQESFSLFGYICAVIVIAGVVLAS